MSLIKPPKLGAKQLPQGTPPRPSLSVRWGEWMARRRWWVLSAWGVLMVAAALSYPHLMSSLVASDYSVTGSDSQRVTKLIESGFAAVLWPPEPGAEGLVFKDGRAARAPLGRSGNDGERGDRAKSLQDKVE